jgi:hypothetical protein
LVINEQDGAINVVTVNETKRNAVAVEWLRSGSEGGRMKNGKLLVLTSYVLMIAGVGIAAFGAINGSAKVVWCATAVCALGVAAHLSYNAFQSSNRST